MGSELFWYPYISDGMDDNCRLWCPVLDLLRGRCLLSDGKIEVFFCFLLYSITWFLYVKIDFCKLFSTSWYIAIIKFMSKIVFPMTTERFNNTYIYCNIFLMYFSINWSLITNRQMVNKTMEFITRQSTLSKICQWMQICNEHIF